MELLGLLARQEEQPAGNGTAEDPAAAAAAAMAALITKGDPAPVVTPAIWVMIALATVFLALRLYCRIAKSHLWWDDYILIVGWVIHHSGPVEWVCLGTCANTWDRRS